MLEQQILKAILNKETYDAHREQVKLSDGLSSWLDTLDRWMETHDSSLTVDDLYQLHIARHPVATKGQRDLMEVAYQNLKTTEINSEVIIELLSMKTSQDKYMQWAEKLVKLGEGKAEAEEFNKLVEEMGSFHNSPLVANAFDPLDITPEQMLEASAKQGQWTFNIRVLQDMISGVGAGVFALISARPNSGKSLTAIHTSFAPGGWLEQGAKIVYLGNEEAIHRTKHRAICSWSGLEYKHTKANHEEFIATAKEFDEKFKDKIVFLHKTGMMYSEVETLLKQHAPDILIIDQLDKLHVRGDAPSHEKMRVVYTTMREFTVNYNCCIIGVCQASEAAAGKKFFGFEALEHSKTGKAAELDLCICIGKEDTQEDNNVRYFRLAKNKLTGNENTGSFMIDKERSRLIN
jgi:predicted ATP-dependent serine protease